MTKEGKIFISIAIGAVVSMVGIGQYNINKERKLREKEIENQRRYFDKLSPEQVELIETKKLEVKKAEIELDRTEAELKRTVVEFKEEIHDDILDTVTRSIENDMRDTFDSWSSKFEDRLDKKVDRVVSRIDNLSDKYGGVKQNASQPTISVVNAPNN